MVPQCGDLQRSDTIWYWRHPWHGVHSYASPVSWREINLNQWVEAYYRLAAAYAA